MKNKQKNIQQMIKDLLINLFDIASSAKIISATL
jgi:hypothetical protein